MLIPVQQHHHQQQQRTTAAKETLLTDRADQITAIQTITPTIEVQTTEVVVVVVVAVNLGIEEEIGAMETAAAGQTMPVKTITPNMINKGRVEKIENL